MVVGNGFWKSGSGRSIASDTNCSFNGHAFWIEKIYELDYDGTFFHSTFFLIGEETFSIIGTTSHEESKDHIIVFNLLKLIAFRCFDTRSTDFPDEFISVSHSHTPFVFLCFAFCRGIQTN